jgi:hypothetical protein
MVAAAGTREAAGIPAVVVAHIFQHPMAAAHLISPLAPRLTLVEAAHISLPAYRTVDRLFTPRLTVQRRTMHS